MECIKCKIDLNHGGGMKGANYQSLHTSGKWKQKVYFCSSCVDEIINDYNKTWKR